MNVFERRAEILRILEGRRQETIKNLAFQLGVSVRTVKYDIEALMAEYPLETIRGNGGCVKLLDGYHIYQGDITEEQQLKLIYALPQLDKSTAVVLAEMLRAHGSYRNKTKIEEAIENVNAS